MYQARMAALIFSKPFVAVFYEFSKPFVAVFYEFSKPLWLLVCCVCLLIVSMLFATIHVLRT